MASVSPLGLLSTLVAYRNAIFYYLLGGITFLPLCAFVVVAHFYFTAPKYTGKGTEDQVDTLHDQQIGDLTEQRKRDALDLAVWNAEAEQSAKDGQDKDAAVGSSTAPAAARRVGPPPQTPKKPHRSGWLVVRRNFQSDVVNQQLQNAATLAAAQVKADKEAEQAEQREKDGEDSNYHGANGQNGAKGGGYMTMMYRGMLNYRNRAGHGKNGDGGSEPSSRDGNEGGSNKGQTASSSHIISSGSSNGREAFHCILKGPVLFLYSAADPNSPATECHAAIDLRHKRVSIYVAGVGDTMGEPDFNDEAIQGEREATTEASTSEAEEAQKARVAAKQARRVRVREGELFVKRNAIRIVSLGTKNNVEGTRFAQWFIFAKSATVLEDWYHALIQASSLPDGHDAIFSSANPVGGAFSTHDMSNLLSNLDQVPDPIPLRWLNAMVGRIFFSIYRTAWVESYIKSKMMKKIARVRTPSYLSNINVQEVDLGRSAPAFSRPMLKSLTGDGEASMEVNVHYRGAIRLTISTTLTISLGSRFKQYTVSLVLAVILHSLEGNLLLHIKPPPSNRLWFGFTKLPKMEIDIEPVVSERKVQWSMVKRLLEGRIRELLTESLVVPNMDDVPFFDTRAYDRRGGIWAEMAKAAWQRDRTPDPQSMLEEAEKDKTTGVATAPKSKSTPASMIDVKTDEEDENDGGDESSAAVAASSAIDIAGVDAALRNRRVGTVESASDARSSASSPAAAGLSTLLARDKAWTGDSAQSSSDARPQKRRSWFVGKNASGSKLAMPTSASRIGGGKPQSSLAWGSASLEPKPASHDRADSVSSTPAVQPEDVQAEDIGIDDDPQVSIENSEDVPTGIPVSASNQSMDAVDDRLDEAADTANTTTESFNVSSASASTESREMARTAPPLPQRKGTDMTVTDMPPPPPRRPDLARGNSQSSQRSTSTYASSPAAQSLASIQRERYGNASRQEDHAGRGGAPSSVALAATWQRAKASMADKESRQAAAKDAKDALKRGWANWNARRTGQPATNDPPTPTRIPGVTPPAAPQPDPLQQEDTQRMPRSRTSSWLASSPEDPISLGMGFNVHEDLPAPSELWLDESRGRAAQSNTASPGQTTSSSRASSISGRKPYREHLAHKKKPSVGDTLSSQASSRRSSVHSVADDTLPSTHAEASALPTSSSSNSLSAWDAPVFDLPAPMPIAKKREDDVGKGMTRRTSSVTSTSPSTVRRTPSLMNKLGDEGKSEGLASSTGSYNFMPGQPVAVTGLSGFETTHPRDEAQKDGPLHSPDTAPPDIDATPRKASFATSTNARASELTAGSPRPDVAPLATSVMGAPTSPSLGGDASPPTTGPVQGIKQQPKRANMMAVPGIPSMQKQGPQSFEAPASAQPSKEGAKKRNASPEVPRGSPTPSSSSRMGLQGLLPRLPSFSPPQGNSAVGTPRSEASATSKPLESAAALANATASSEADVVSASNAVQSAAVHAEPPIATTMDKATDAIAAEPFAAHKGQDVPTEAHSDGAVADLIGLDNATEASKASPGLSNEISAVADTKAAAAGEDL